jgi:transcriptional regulator with PAS, ATPase and Fis domain
MTTKESDEAGVIVASTAMQHIQDEVRQAARADAKILITGESGVGKEVVARQIHRYSTRSAKPFVAINCAGVPDSLLESELFGHVRGSFTGAYRDKPGLLEQAHGGTIFMDEVGEMSLRMQALLLRFLEDGDIYRVGSERRNATVNVRVVAATNRVLLDRIASNDFREDLYYRLNVIHLVIPPLRDRIEDIEPLLHHFLRAFSDKYGAAPPELDPDVLPALLQHPWPGNVRELKNVAERLIVRAKKGPIRVDDLPPLIASGGVTSQPVRPAPLVASLNGVAEPPTRSVAELFDRIVTRRESFWNAVYTPFMSRDLTRDDVRALVKAGLQHTRGNYKVLLELFNMEPGDYKRFLNFLRKHQCHMRFQQFRTSEPIRPAVESSTRAAGF